MLAKLSQRQVTRPAPKVMIVEDNPQFVYLIQRYAASSGCLCVQAGCSEAAVRLAQEEHPDLILLDVVPGAGDSHAVLAALKADPATRAIPLYLCSASEAALGEWECQADGCLLKPVMYADFQAVLTTVSTRTRPSE
jgi:CheY-like chemotaxis protein